MLLLLFPGCEINLLPCSPAAGGGGLFGAASQPASTPAFGFGTAATGGSLFGSTPASTPAFGASTGGGLFGGGGGLFGATPTFGASPQLGAQAGALVPTQPVQVRAPFDAFAWF